MSGNSEEEKGESGKMVPLDLARNQIAAAVKAVDGKAPIVIPGQHLRGMRVLAQAVSSGSVPATVTTPAIITTNILPPAVLKQDNPSARTQIAGIVSGTPSIAIQRPVTAQITLAAATVPAVNTATTYHVPRGPAVVANLAAPRGTVSSAIRAPQVVASAQTSSFVRPPRAPSPAQAWLAASQQQAKGTTTTVLGSSARGATVVVGKGQQQGVGAKQQVGQGQQGQVMRPTTAAILHSAITIGQGAQLHPFKPGQGATLTNAVTIAQVLPPRTQALVYNTGNSTHFAPGPRLTVASTVQGRQTTSTPRPLTQVSTARLSLPVSVTQTTARLITPQTTVLASGARLSTPQQQPVTSTRLAPAPTPQANATHLGRLTVTNTAAAQQPTNNVLGQTRISTLSLHPLVAVANGSQQRSAQTKVIGQATQSGAIQLAQVPTVVKTTQGVATTTNRTINVQPGAIMTQRQGAVVSTQQIPIAKVITQGETQQNAQQANVFIHTPVATLPRRSSPALSGPTGVAQQTTGTVTTSITTYTLANSTYFYETSSNFSVARSFAPQSTFTTLSQQQQIRSSTLGAQVHSIVGTTNQQMRFNPVMVMDQNRTFAATIQEEQQQQQQPPPQQMTKVTSSPRPSILRKRDHDGAPLKAAKNLAPILAAALPASPPSRPDSRGNGHSSGGSTTISATSSPGIADANEDSLPKAEEEEETEVKKPIPTPQPSVEMSPRKKPRKQRLTTTLTGNDPTENDGEMQFISEATKKTEDDESDGNRSDGPRDGAPEARRVTTVRKPASASLLNSYRQNWKATHNHYLRYSDVRPKDERRPTIMDLANQYRVLHKVNGWKIHHLSTQMEDLAEQEDSVYVQLSELLKCTESEDVGQYEKEINRINELIKGNLQRTKIIKDGMIDAKAQIMKIFDHKVHVTDIINRCASKRNFKKREKS